MTKNSLADLSDGHLIATVAVKARRAVQLLREIALGFSPAVFANSLGAEDIVLTDLIVKKKLGIEIISVDTGRLPPESHDLIAELEGHYGIRFNVYHPRHDLLQSYVRDQGTNGFYDSVAQRESCCEVRKIEPLKRALVGKKAWISGLRADPADTGAAPAIREFDAATGLEKFNPLTDWSEREIWSYIRTRNLPYNRLHDQHYPVIGCSPCTRPAAAGVVTGAKRWWWETPATHGSYLAKQA